jgi:hypothetical protein
MTEISRRGFFTRASVVGVGAAAMVTGLGSLTDAGAAQDKTGAEPELSIDGSAPEDVVVHIRDIRTSEVALIAGHEEFIYHDPRLVRSVLHKFTAKTKE